MPIQPQAPTYPQSSNSVETAVPPTPASPPTENASAQTVAPSTEQVATSNQSAQHAEVQAPPPGLEHPQQQSAQPQNNEPIPGLMHQEQIKKEQEEKAAQAAEQQRQEQIRAQQEASAEAQRQAEIQAQQEQQRIQQEAQRRFQEEQARLQQQAQQQAEAAAAAQVAQAEKDFAVGNAPLENNDGTPIVGLDPNAAASSSANVENTPSATANSAKVEIQIDKLDHERLGHAIMLAEDVVNQAAGTKVESEARSAAQGAMQRKFEIIMGVDHDLAAIQAETASKETSKNS